MCVCVCVWWQRDTVLCIAVQDGAGQGRAVNTSIHLDAMLGQLLAGYAMQVKEVCMLCDAVGEIWLATPHLGCQLGHTGPC